MQYQLKYAISSIGILIFGVLLMLRSQKTKADLQPITGRVVYYRKFLPGHFNRSDADSTSRYLRINSFPKTFALGVPASKPDPEDAPNLLDHLKIGDTITVYLATPLPFQAHSDTITNYDAEFIDRGRTPYFVRGNGDRIGAYGFLALGGILLLVLPSLKFKQ